MPFVVDASVVGSWVLPDENHPETLAALERLKDDEAFAPSLLWFELRNLLDFVGKCAQDEKYTLTFLSDEFTTLNELIETWFDDARQKHNAAQRLAFLLVAFFAALHVTTFDQYLAFQQQLRGAGIEMGEAAQTSSVLDKVAAITKELNQTIKMRLEELMQSLVENLKEDFEALDRTIAILSGELQDIQPELQQQQQQQQVRVQPRQIELEPTLQEQLKITSDPAAIRRLVTPAINEKIIARRFSEATATWRGELLPALDAEAATLEETLRSLPSHLDTTFPGLPKLRTQISQFRSKAKTLIFVPPPGEWWRAVETKFQTAREIGVASVHNLDPAAFATAAEDLKHLSAVAEEAAESAEKHLKERMTALEKSFAEQEAHVSDLAKPLAFLALDLDFVAHRFPMLLGAALGVAFFWPAYRRLELARAFLLLSQQKQTLTWADTIGLTPARKSLWMLVVAASAWVALASWQLVQSGLIAILWHRNLAYRERASPNPCRCTLRQHRKPTDAGFARPVQISLSHVGRRVLVIFLLLESVKFRGSRMR